jgi:hypothetical protein
MIAAMVSTRLTWNSFRTLFGVAAGSADVNSGTDLSTPLSLRKTATPFGSARAATIGEWVETNVWRDNAWMR